MHRYKNFVIIYKYLFYKKMAQQFELDFKKPSGRPVEYRFGQDYLKGIVRKEVGEIIGDPDRLAEAMDVPDVRKAVQDALEPRGLKADFRDNAVIIRKGEKDITGEYYEEYEKARRAG